MLPMLLLMTTPVNTTQFTSCMCYAYANSDKIPQMLLFIFHLSTQACKWHVPITGLAHADNIQLWY
jgi:hypothetical protein